MAKSKEVTEASQVSPQVDNNEQLNESLAEETVKVNPVIDVLKSVSKLSLTERLSLYRSLDPVIINDRDRYSSGVADFDATGAIENAIKGL